ncbi:MAG TPA: ESPR-type extended signal peptide-containing protein, partial [Lysobacter sp.]
MPDVFVFFLSRQTGVCQMNKIYRVVWNAETGQWVVASEMAKGRKKSSTSKVATAAVLVVGASLGGNAFAAVGPNGSLQLCNPSGGRAYGTAGVDAALDCSPVTAYGGEAFSLNNKGETNGGYGFSSSTARVTGYNDGTLELKGTSGISVLNQMNMNGNKITGIAPGSVAAGSTDAITGDQLFKLQNGGTKYFHANSTAADSQANGGGSVAIGGGAKSDGSSTVAIGEGAQATYDQNMAVGAGAYGGGGASIAIGTNASTAAIGGANYQTALGAEAKSEVNMGTALGGRANAKADSSVALGSESVADRGAGIGGSSKGAVSVGSGGAGVAATTRQIISVARGTQDTDAVNLSQLKGVTTALGGGAAVNADGTVKAPSYDVGSTTGISTVGGAINALDDRIDGVNSTVTNITNGGGIKYFHANSAGADSKATGSDSVAIGPNAVAGVANSIAVGAGAKVDSTDSDNSGVAVGVAAHANGVSNAFGYNANASGSWSTASGVFATASGANSVALGDSTNASVATGVALGSGSVADRASGTGGSTKGAVSVGSGGAGVATGTRQIISVARGTQDTDAVNVSQLKGVTTALGGGSAVNADGTIKAPSYDVGTTTGIPTVGGAINALDDRIDGVAANPLKFSGNSGTDVSRKLGDTLKISGLASTAGTFSGNNIKTVADATTGEIKIQMADAPKFGNITVNDSGKISGLADGTAAGDAVTKGQLDAAVIGAGAGWKLKANAGTEGTIKGGDTLDVVDGTNTKVAFDSTKNELKVSVADAPTFSGMVTANGGLTVGAGKTVDMGGNKITKVAAGTADTDAVNISQLKGITTAMGGGAAVNTDGTIKAPSYDVGSTTGIPTVGGAINALDDRIDGVAANPLKFSGNSGTDVSRKLGDTLKISGLASTAGTFSGNNIKTVADATTGEIKIQMADAPKFGNITVNDSGKISGLTDGTAATDAVTKGQMDTAVAGAGKWKLTANGATAKTITSSDTVNLVDGKNTKASFDSTTNQLKVDVVDAPTFSGMVTANGGLTVGAGKTVDMGGNKITKVAAGTADTDAVNVSQLKGITTAMGGGAAVASDGTITQPTYTVDGKDAKGVDGAITALDDSIKSAKDGIDGLNADTADVVKYDAADHKKVTFGEAGKPVVLDNVDNGLVAKDSKQAINGGQLFDVQTALTDKGMVFGANSGTNVTRKLGETLGIKGGATPVAGTFSDKNVQTATDTTNGGIVIKMADSPQFGTIVINKGGNGSIDMGGGKVTNMGDATAAGDAVNKGQMDKAIADAAGGVVGSPLTFAGNTGTVARKLGETVTIKGGKKTAGTYSSDNITTEAAADGSLTIKMADAPKFGDITVNDAGKITGLENGTAAGDAATAGQLQELAGVIGGDTKVDPTTGEIKQPTFTITDKDGNEHDSHTVADGFSTLDGRMDSIDGRVTIVEGNVTNIMNGAGIKYFHTNSTLADSQAKGVDSVAIGGNAVANAKNSVALGSNSTADRENTVSVGAAGAERQIVNVKAGVQPTDAVNVSQLKGIADVIGGGTTIDANTGAITPPTFNVTDKDGNVVPATSLVDAITKVDGHVVNVDKRVTNIEGDVTNILDGKAGLVQQDETTREITVGKDTDGTVVNFTNKDGEARVLDGVANGEIKEGSQQAINGGQAYDIANSMAEVIGGGATVTDGKISL